MSDEFLNQELMTLRQRISELENELKTLKKTEEALQISESKFRDIAATMPGVIFQFSNRDNIWRVDYMSEQIYEICGITATEIMENLGLFIQQQHPEDLPNYLASVEKVIQDLSPWHYEGRLIKPNGEIRWWQGDSRPCKNEHNEIVFSGVLLDITQRKNAEEKLYESERELRTLFGAMQDVVLVLDYYGYYLKIAPTNPSLLYKPSQDLLGKNLEDVMPKQQAEFFLNYIQQTLTSQASMNVEYSLSIGDEIKWFQATLSPLTDSQIIMVARDITERKQAENLLENAKEELELRVAERTTELNRIVKQLQTEIRERQSAEESLRQSEARFQRLAANAPGMIYEFKMSPQGDFSFSYVSPFAQELYELEPEMLLKDANLILAQIHPNDRQVFLNLIANSMETLTPFQWEGKMTTPSGKNKWVRAASKPEKQKNEDIIWDGLLMDVTDLKEAELELERTNSELEAIFKTLPDLYFRMNLEGEILDYQQGSLRQLYVPPEFFLGKKMTDVLPPDVAQIFVEGLEKTILSKSLNSIEYQLPLNDILCYFECRLLPLGDQEIIAIIRDISDRKKAEQNLKKSQELLEQIINTIPQYIAWKDVNSVYSGCNSNLAELVGVGTPKNIIGKTDYDIHLTHEQAKFYQESDRRVMESNQPIIHLVEPYKIINGEERWLDTCKFPLRDSEENITGLLLMFEDITERLQAEAALRNSQQRLSILVKNSPIAVIEWNMVFEVTAWNKKAEEIFGYSQEETLGRHAAGLIVPAHVKELVDEIFSRLVKQEGGNRSTNENITKDGRIITCDWFNVPLISPEGEVISIASMVLDITEQKEAERKLKETQQFLELVLDNLPVGVFTKESQNLRFVLWNKAAENLLGFTSEQVLGKNDYDFFPPEQADFFTQKDREVLNHRTILEIPEEEIITATGKNLVLHTKKTAIVNEQNHPQYLLAIIEDITERKRVQKELEKQAKFLQSIWDGVEYGIFVLEVLAEENDFRYTAFNPAMSQNSPVSVESLIGKTVREALPPEMATTYCQRYLQCLQSGQSYLIEEKFIVQDSVTWWLLNITPLKNFQGETDKLVVTATNITQRKQAEEALKEQLQLAGFRAEIDGTLTRSESLQQMLQSCAEAVVEHLGAALARIWVLNPQENLLELQASAGLYTHLNGQHSRIPVGHLKLGKIVSEQEPYITNSVTNDLKIIDQEWAKQQKLVSFAGYPLKINDETLGVVAMFSQHPLSDSTVESLGFVANEVALGIKRKQAEEALRESETKLREKAQDLEQALNQLQLTQSQLIQSEKMSSLGQLVAGVAHEINNPVNFIYGNLTHTHDYSHGLLELLELYQLHYPNPPSEIQEKSEEIDLEFIIEDLPKVISSMKLGAERIEKIVSSLRIFSRMDESEQKAVNIHDGLDSTLLILQNRLKDKPDKPGIEVIKHYDDLPLIECYAGQLNQVFMNILSNAIDALDERDSKRSKSEIKKSPSRIWIETQQLEKEVKISVKDNGVGMTETIRKRLFDPFFTTKPVGKGTGMGLSISYQIITQRHQGSLECISEPGKGAEFVIKIPLKFV